MPTLRLLACIFLASSFHVLPAQTTREIKKLQNESASLKKKISESEKLIVSTKKDVRAQMSNLQLLNSKINEQQKYVDGITAEVSALQSNLAELQQQQSALRADLERCKAQYRRSVNYMYRNRSSQSRLMFLLKSKDFNQMRRRMRYMQEFSKFQRAQGEDIQRKEALVRQQEEAISATKKEKDQKLAEGQQEQKKLEGKKRERQAVVNELGKKQTQLQAQLKQQKKKYNSLNAQIDRLIKIEIEKAEARRKAEEKRRREEAARKAAAKAKNGKSGEAKTGEATREAKTSKPSFHAADAADRKLNGSFEANRGRLPVPITGAYAITRHFGRYNVDGLKGVQLESKGINITGSSGAQARCVFDGEVSAVSQVGGMYLIIVRHGSYMSVYYNLASVGVKKGQQVKARQTLGSIARDAGGNCTMQFQLLHRSTRLNPESWIGR